MSSPQQVIIFIPVLFCCQVGDERVCRTQYVAVPSGADLEQRRAAAQRVMNEIANAQRLEYAFDALIRQGQPMVCGFEILPITAIPRPS